MSDSSHYPRLYGQYPKLTWRKVVKIERADPALMEATGRYIRWAFHLDCGHRAGRAKVNRRAIDAFDAGTLHVICRRCAREGREARRVG